jgi:protocatechuate 3,4-dioxygenase beta subunit
VQHHQDRGRAQTYEGRPLARPDDELVDQGLGFDLGTLLHRRQMLRVFGLGAAVAGLAACGDASSDSSAGSSPAASSSSSSSSSPSTSTSTSTPSGSSTAEIPEETAGPYPGDGSNGPNVLQQSGIVRSDIRSSFGSSSGKAEGVPMTVELTIKDLANGGKAFAGAAVYLWHCDREGRYSLYSQGVTGQNYLRGVQIADAAGTVRFTSIFPGCYAGRWPHAHFEVYPDQAAIAAARNAIATSQVALPKATCDTVYATTGYQTSVANLAKVSLQSDGVFGNDGGVTQLGTATGDTTSGYTISLTVGVDTTTAAGR